VTAGKEGVFSIQTAAEENGYSYTIIGPGQFNYLEGHTIQSLDFQFTKIRINANIGINPPNQRRLFTPMIYGIRVSSIWMMDGFNPYLFLICTD